MSDAALASGRHGGGRCGQRCWIEVEAHVTKQPTDGTGDDRAWHIVRFLPGCGRRAQVGFDNDRLSSRPNLAELVSNAFDLGKQRRQFDESLDLADCRRLVPDPKVSLLCQNGGPCPKIRRAATERIAQAAWYHVRRGTGHGGIGAKIVLDPLGAAWFWRQMQDAASVLTDRFSEVLERLPAGLDLDVLALEAKAIQRRREVVDGAALLRIALARGPGGLSLRQTAAWASMQGIAELSNPGVKYRLDPIPFI